MIRLSGDDHSLLIMSMICNNVVPVISSCSHGGVVDIYFSIRSVSLREGVLGEVEVCGKQSRNGWSG